MLLRCCSLLLVLSASACGVEEPEVPQKSCIDEDGDGYGKGSACDGFDCDDDNALRHPGALEVCDAAGLDEDCDGGANDDDPSGASDGTVYYRDVDGDGHGDVLDVGATFCSTPAGRAASRDDCDDADATINPGVAEVCDDDDVDEDCNDLSDDDDPLATGFADTYYPDGDQDGHGDAGAAPQGFCDPALGRSLVGDDCDDDDADVSPDADEVCDALESDEDCDGEADDLDSSALGKLPFWPDGDDDGDGDELADAALFCDVPATHASQHTDCDDGNGDRFPANPEVADDGVDQDCSSGDACLTDADDDGAVQDTTTLVVSSDLDCDDPFEGESGEPLDCADHDAARYPGNDEVADDGADQDCVAGDACLTDADDDGAVLDSTTLVASADLDCLDPFEGEPGDDTDCDDGDEDRFPANPEVVNDGQDQDCVAGDACYKDDDEDGARTEEIVASADLDCLGAKEGVPADLLDCEDDDPNVKPGATEVCDDADTDDDCDGGADDADPEEDALGKTAIYTDGDGDGHGLEGSASLGTECDADALENEAAVDDDCDDTTSARHPGLEEVAGNDVDEDCDEVVDCFVDDDRDGAKDHADTTVASADMDCDDAGEGPDGPLDCNITDGTVYPGAPEICDNQQNDCDDTDWALADEDGLVTHLVNVAGQTVVTEVNEDFTAAPTYALQSEGSLAICPGTYAVRLTFAGGDLQVASRGGSRAAAAETVIDAAGGGPALYVTGGALGVTGLTLTGGTGISTGLATLDGGGAAVTGGSLTLNNSFVVGNHVNGDGGGIFANPGASVSVLNTDIGGTDPADYNTAGRAGGGIYALSAALNIAGSRITHNVANEPGGGVYVASVFNVTITDSFIEDNQGRQGAGIYAISVNNLQVTGSYITGNSVVGPYAGGGMYLTTASATLTNTTLSGNSAPDGGGGARVYGGSITLIEPHVFGNSGGGTGGGGFLLIDSVALSCTAAEAPNTSGAGIYDNTASVGGGILAYTNTNSVTNNPAKPCNFGADADSDENDPEDVYLFWDDSGFDVEGSTAFACNFSGCAETP